MKLCVEFSPKIPTQIRVFWRFIYKSLPDYHKPLRQAERHIGGIWDEPFQFEVLTGRWWQNKENELWAMYAISWLHDGIWWNMIQYDFNVIEYDSMWFEYDWMKASIVEEGLSLEFPLRRVLSRSFAVRPCFWPRCAQLGYAYAHIPKVTTCTNWGFLCRNIAIPGPARKCNAGPSPKIVVGPGAQNSHKSTKFKAHVTWASNLLLLCCTSYKPSILR